ncbi:alpha/beta hydrolase [Neiella marina]|uniref:Alpha/beta hydrolase n=1 Tax=Neiella holothuriorum TaxID=2870530 RepID=A0ABS7EDG5_9GAMM|nr:alpha/beta hydrolase [Neiella holothuriorum]MBW8190386.1 alpha/beta hydrolase [Neiella holothuriorum]
MTRYLLLVLLCCWSWSYQAHGANDSNFTMPKLPANVRYFHDVPIGQVGNVQLYIDIAVPAQALATPAPAIVAIHGGGWRKGHKNKFASKIVNFAKRGYVAASLMYRLAPDHPFPAAVEDVKVGVRFLKAHAEQYGVNPNQIIALGSSAGGHLAAMLGATGNDDSFSTHGLWDDVDSSVMLAVTFSGPNAEFDSQFADQWSSITKFLGGKASSRPDIAKAAMPISYLDANDPPFFVVHGNADNIVPVSMGRTFVEGLKSAGVEHRYIEIEGGTHKLKQSAPQAQKQAYQQAWQMIEEVIAAQEE